MNQLILLFSSLGKDGFMTIVLYCKNSFYLFPYLGTIKHRKTRKKLTLETFLAPDINAKVHMTS